jgi:hypothetical protein
MKTVMGSLTILLVLTPALARAVVSPSTTQTSATHPATSPTTKIRRVQPPAKVGHQLAKYGHVEIQFTDFGVGKVPGRFRMDGVWIKLTLTNKSSTKPVEFTRWSSVGMLKSEGPRAQYSWLIVGDQIQNENAKEGTHVERALYDWAYAGTNGKVAIEPGKSTEQVLVFPRPSIPDYLEQFVDWDLNQRMDIKLPAENVGGTGVISFPVDVPWIDRSKYPSHPPLDFDQLLRDIPQSSRAP